MLCPGDGGEGTKRDGINLEPACRLAVSRRLYITLIVLACSVYVSVWNVRTV
jgi:hypothetical protein